MWWILIWVLLVLAAAAVLALLGWRLFRQVLALGREIGASGGRVADTLAALHRPEAVAAPSSVFLDPGAQPEVGRRSRGRRRRRA